MLFFWLWPQVLACCCSSQKKGEMVGVFKAGMQEKEGDKEEGAGVRRGPCSCLKATGPSRSSSVL